MSRACGILLLWVLLAGNAVHGQDSSPATAPSETTPMPPSESASPSAEDTPTTPALPGDVAETGQPEPTAPQTDPPTAEAQGPLPQEHIIYLPFDKLHDVFEKQDSSIVLPYAQFLDMWNRLTQAKPGAQPLPVHGVISRAEYVGTVQGERVLLDVSLEIEALTADWARIPVMFGEAAIGSAQSPDGTVLVRGVGEGQYELLVKGPGKHQVKLGLVIAVQAATEGRSSTVQ